MAAQFLWIDTRFRFVGSLPKSAALLDIGSSDGQTLGHFSEARPDLSFYSTDLEGKPEQYPAGTDFLGAISQVMGCPGPLLRWMASVRCIWWSILPALIIFTRNAIDYLSPGHLCTSKLLIPKPFIYRCLTPSRPVNSPIIL